MLHYLMTYTIRVLDSRLLFCVRAFKSTFCSGKNYLDISFLNAKILGNDLPVLRPSRCFREIRGLDRSGKLSTANSMRRLLPYF